MSTLNSDTSLSEPRRKAQTIGLILGPSVFLTVFFFPHPSALSATAQAMTAIAALMTIWWLTEAIPIPATSMLPLALFPLFGVSTMQEAASPYSNHLVYLFLGGFMLALAIERVNLHRRIALNVIRLVGSSPTRLVLGFMLSTAFISMWISNTATMLMMLPIALAVISEMAKPREDELDHTPAVRSFSVALLLGIAYASSIGGVGTLIGTPPNIVFAGFVRKLYPSAPEIGFFQWMLFGIPLVVIFLPLTWFMITRVVAEIPLTRLHLGKDLAADMLVSELRSLGNLSAAERRVLIIFLITTLAWIFRAPLELGAVRVPGLVDLLPGLTDSAVAMIAGTSLFVIPLGKRGSGFIMNWETVQRGVPWGVLLLFGGGFALADGLERSGITLFLGQQIAGMSAVPVLVMILLVCTLLTFLTELTSNTATATILLPVMASAAVALGQHPFLFMIPATLNASFAFMLPVATPPNAIIFSSTFLTVRQMARAGFVLNFIGIVLVTGLMYLIGFQLFGISLDHLPAWMQ